MHVYRWDLDKTYLATDIDSVRGLVRAALESAEDKRNVPGAPALWRALLAHDATARAEIISGSPTQMRSVIEEKLALDGIRFDALVLKDNLGNLRKGRLRAVRGQLGYKLPHLLSLRLAHPEGTTESLFGDDSEVDALVYALYASCLNGRTSAREMSEIMLAAGAYEDQVEAALRSVQALVARGAIPTATPSVTGIFIHVDRRLPLTAFHKLGIAGGVPEVRVVFSWFQAALVLHAQGRLDHLGVDAVAADCAHAPPRRAAPIRTRSGSPIELAALVQDAVRRNLLPAEAALAACDGAPTLGPAMSDITKALAHLDRWTAPPVHVTADWSAFLDAASRE